MRIAVIACLFAIAVVAQSPVERALLYLSTETPRWRSANGCFSCHNNGDGVRALYAAKRFDPAKSTTTFLTSPAEWEKGKANPAYSDKTLALYQFAAALTSAVEAGATRELAPLKDAARRLAQVQQPDGSWRVEDEGDAPGSPVTWGTTLATYFGYRTVRSAGGPAAALQKAENWLRLVKPLYMADEAAVLLALPKDPVVRKRALDRFTRSQTSDGGWGPSANAPAEVFDTAVVILALEGAGIQELTPRARRFLLQMQQKSGGWPETTRPPGSQSYAQHISTTAWATMALLATER